jgi:hypothetical protein
MLACFVSACHADAHIYARFLGSAAIAGELRSIVVADEQSHAPGHDPQHFPGFPAAGVVEGPSV